MGLCLEKNLERDIQNKSNAEISQQQTQQSIQQKYEELIILRDNQSSDGRLTIRQWKYGRISKDYTLLNPPLGRGIFFALQKNQKIQGIYGEVRKAIHKRTNQLRAIKIIDKLPNYPIESQKLLNQVQLLQKLDHPNIIDFLEFYQDEKYYYIVTELCIGGELFDKIQDQGQFSEVKAAQTMFTLLRFVNYLHLSKIMHRELKPENILYQSRQENSLLKIIGFTKACEFIPNQKQNSRVGTPYYIAPEVINKNYDEKCDIWSLGVILYILLCGYIFKTKVY